MTRADRYVGLHPCFRAAFEFLQRADLAALPDGRHEVDGDRVFAILARERGRGLKGVRLEVHRRYIDIQCVISGGEIIGHLSAEHCRHPVDSYDEQRDIAFYSDRAETWVSLPPGAFMILFPDDAHAPLAGRGDVRKAVVKIAIDE